jgi:hypothetical protein
MFASSITLYVSSIYGVGVMRYCILTLTPTGMRPISHNPGKRGSVDVSVPLVGRSLPARPRRVAVVVDRSVNDNGDANGGRLKGEHWRPIQVREFTTEARRLGGEVA